MTDQNEAAALEAAAKGLYESHAETLHAWEAISEQGRAHWRKDALAIITAYKQALPAAPGVPREPTELMIQRGYQAVGRTHYEPDANAGWGVQAKMIWQTMWDAAPSAPLASTANSATAPDLGVSWHDVQDAVSDALIDGEGTLSAYYLEHYLTKAGIGVYGLPDHPSGEIELLQAQLASTVAAPGVTLRDAVHALEAEAARRKENGRTIYDEYAVQKIEEGAFYLGLAAHHLGAGYLLTAPTPVAASGPTLGSVGDIAWECREAAEIERASGDFSHTTVATLDRAAEEITALRARLAPTSAGPSLVAAETEACAREIERQADLQERILNDDGARELRRMAAILRDRRVPTALLKRMEAKRAVIEAATEMWLVACTDTDSGIVAVKMARARWEKFCAAMDRLTPQGEAKTKEGDAQ